MPAAPFDSEIDETTRRAIAEYWANPVDNADVIASPVAETVTAYRFSFVDDPTTRIRGLAREGTRELLDIIATGPTMHQLAGKLTPIQDHFLRRLVRAGMVTAVTHAHPSPRETVCLRQPALRA